MIIESMSILRGMLPQSAIYGSRGANGVCYHITDKSGKGGAQGRYLGISSDLSFHPTQDDLIY